MITITAVFSIIYHLTVSMSIFNAILTTNNISTYTFNSQLSMSFDIASPGSGPNDKKTDTT